MKRMILVTINALAMVLVAGAAYAQATGYSSGGSNQTAIYLGMAAAFTIAVAAVGGAFAQSRAASAALEGIARNPEAAGKVMTPMIIALALIESLVIYALVIAFLLQAKV